MTLPNGVCSLGFRLVDQPVDALLATLVQRLSEAIQLATDERLEAYADLRTNVAQADGYSPKTSPSTSSTVEPGTSFMVVTSITYSLVREEQADHRA